MSAPSLRPPDDDTQPIPVVRGRHAAPRRKRSVGAWALLIGREAGIILGIVAVLIILFFVAVIYLLVIGPLKIEERDARLRRSGDGGEHGWFGTSGHHHKDDEDGGNSNGSNN